MALRGTERLSHPDQNREGFLEGIFQGDLKESLLIHQVTKPAKEIAQILDAYSNCQHATQELSRGLVGDYH